MRTFVIQVYLPSISVIGVSLLTTRKLGWRFLFISPKIYNYFIHMMYGQRRVTFSFTIDSNASHFYLPIPPRRNPTHVSSSPITPINLPRADAIAILNKFGYDGDYTIIVTLMLYQSIFSWVSWPLTKIFVSILIGWSSYTAFQQHN